MTKIIEKDAELVKNHEALVVARTDKHNTEKKLEVVSSVLRTHHAEITRRFDAMAEWQAAAAKKAGTRSNGVWARLRVRDGKSDNTSTTYVGV